MQTSDLIGHVGYVLLLIGSVALVRRARWGWLARFGGEAIWLGLGIYMGYSSIWLWSFVFMVNDLNGWRTWR
jgi:hypothetical protein